MLQSHCRASWLLGTEAGGGRGGERGAARLLTVTLPEQLCLCVFSPEELFGQRMSEVKLLSRVRLFATPWTVTQQAPLSMGFSRQEYWNGLPFPSPGDLPHPGIEPRSTALQADALLSEPPGKTNKEFMCSKNKRRPLK